MSKKRSETSRGEELPESDDLQLINGIGPAVERRLHGIGIYTYAQLAALSPADIAAAVGSAGGLSSERILKEDWIGQARRLAAGSKLFGPTPPVVVPAGAKEAQIAPPFVAVTGTPRLYQIETTSADTHIPQNCFSHDQPFNVHLTLDLSDVRVNSDVKLSYRTSIFSESLEGHSRQTIGETSGIISFTDKVTISVGGIQLSKGAYRLKAVVILNPMMAIPTHQPFLIASKESDLLLIF